MNGWERTTPPNADSRVAHEPPWFRVGPLAGESMRQYTSRVTPWYPIACICSAQRPGHYSDAFTGVGLAQQLRPPLSTTGPDRRGPGGAISYRMVVCPALGMSAAIGLARNEPQIDLIGADREQPPATVAFIGSIKWREDHRPFGWHEINEVRAKAASVAGATPSTPLVGVSRSDFGPGREELTLALTAEDLIDAWGVA